MVLSSNDKRRLSLLKDYCDLMRYKLEALSGTSIALASEGKGKSKRFISLKWNYEDSIWVYEHSLYADLAALV